jgi:tetraacyldisaccharide 4'-kinase
VRHADALIVTGETPAAAAALAARWGVAHAFTVSPRPSVPRAVDPWGGAVRLPRDRPVVAVAGIARPAAFFDDLEAAGWHLVDRVAFRDHHAFTAADVAGIARRVREHGAAAVLTTEKDAVRLLPLRPLPFAAAFVPLTVTIEPEDVFTRWLLDRLAAAVA